jgi:hypothetical protein
MLAEFRQFIADYPHKTPSQVAAIALTKCPKALICAVLVRVIEEMRRTQARNEVEHSIIMPFLRRYNPTVPTRFEMPREVLTAFRERVAIGDGRRIALLDLTVAQIDERIAFLEKQVAGTLVTISMLRRCREVVVKSGKNSLREAFRTC